MFSRVGGVVGAFSIGRNAANATVLHKGTLQAATATTITLATTAVNDDDYYNDQLAVCIIGTGVGQALPITDYVGSTRVATTGTWPTTLSTDSVVMILPLGLSGMTAADVNAEVRDVIFTDPTTEISTGSGAPSITAPIGDMLRWFYKSWRNEKNQTSTAMTLKDDDGTSAQYTLDVSWVSSGTLTAVTTLDDEPMPKPTRCTAINDGSGEAAGQTSLTVDSTTGMVAGQCIQVVMELKRGQKPVHTSIVASVDSGTVVTMDDALPHLAPDNALVLTYTDAGADPSVWVPAEEMI